MLQYGYCAIRGPIKGGQSVECRGQIFGNVTCRLVEMRVSSVELDLSRMWSTPELIKGSGILSIPKGLLKRDIFGNLNKFWGTS